MPLYSLDPRTKDQNVFVFFSADNNCWYFRRTLDDLSIGHYASEKEALAAARRMSNMGHVHLQPCEKFESPYASNGPTVWHTSQLECIVCYWPGHSHALPPEQPEAA